MSGVRHAEAHRLSGLRTKQDKGLGLSSEQLEEGKERSPKWP